MRISRLVVDQMRSDACAVAVRQALQPAPGVQQVSVTTDGAAVIGYDPAMTDPEALAQDIAQAKHPHDLHFRAQLLY